MSTDNPYHNATDSAADALSTRHMAAGLPVYAARLRSDWAGVGAVDRVISAHADSGAAQAASAATPSTDGEYGRLVARVIEHTPSPALVTLAAKGAEIDTSVSPRVWIEGKCVACVAAEVRHYPGARPLRAEEIDYVVAVNAMARGTDF